MTSLMLKALGKNTSRIFLCWIIQKLVVYYVEIKPRWCAPSRSMCVPFINMHKGRVHDVTHCYNLGKNAFLHLIMCLPPYIMKWIVVSWKNFSLIYLEEMKNYWSLSVSHAVSQVIMRVHKPTVAYKLAVQWKLQGSILTYYYKNTQ